MDHIESTTPNTDEYRLSGISCLSEKHLITHTPCTPLDFSNVPQFDRNRKYFTLENRL